VEELIALFSDDAEYTQPFTGAAQTLRGKGAIGEFLRKSRTHEPPDMLVEVDRIDREGGNIRADWTCTSVAFPGPMRGFDVYEISDGKIDRLTTTLKEAQNA